MLGAVELFAILAILNATITGQNFPLEVDVTPVDGGSGGGSASSAAVAAPTAGAGGLVIDAATITTVLGVAGGLFAMFKKSQSKTDSRLGAVADTVTNVVQSVKSTDIGSKDTAEKLCDLAQVVQSAPPELKQDIAVNAADWKKDVKQYYENIPIAPRPGELENDPVKTKLAQVNKVTEKTEDGGASAGC